MNRILSVYIEKNGKQEYVGKIVGNSSVDACFSYDDSYIEKNGKPISISLPLEEKAFDEKRTRYFFEGLLPEGFTIIFQFWLDLAMSVLVQFRSLMKIVRK